MREYVSFVFGFIFQVNAVYLLISVSSLSEKKKCSFVFFGWPLITNHEKMGLRIVYNHCDIFFDLKILKYLHFSPGFAAHLHPPMYVHCSIV